LEANEAQELQEHAEHGQDSAMRPVALTMTILAVLVALTTVMGHRTHTEAVLNQAKASDTWNEYQSKKNRAYDSSLMTDLLGVVSVANPDGAKKIAKGYADHQEKWADDLKELTNKAKDLEAEVALAEHKAKFFDLGEALLEIGLVITSVTLLTRRRAYWFAGMASSAVGIASVLYALFLK
jgi:uncharacterized membrane protein YtjA (UPF0391 family)